MGVFGFGNVGGAVADESTAGFVTSGLVGLYKCDEETGDRLYDATGNLPPIVLSTGVQLNVTGDGKAVVTDTSGLRAAHNTVGLNGKLVVAGFDGVIPASVVNSTYYGILCRSSSTTVPVALFFKGSGTTRVIPEVRIAAKLDGAALAAYTFTRTSEANTDSTNGGGITPIPVGSYVQCFVVGDFTAGAAPVMTFYWRTSPNNLWSSYQLSSSTATAANTEYVLSSTSGEYMLLADSTTASPTTPWLGKAQAVFVNVGSADADDCKELFDNQSARHIQSVLSSTLGRFWEFRDGSALKAREQVTETAVDITDTATTPTWETSVAGCYQPVLRQGDPGFGKPGVRLGGEASYGANGGGGITDAVSDRTLLTSASGWSFQVTARIGPRDPASASQVIAYCYGADEDGTAITDPTKFGGLGFTQSTEQNVVVSGKQMLSTAGNAGASTVVGAAGASNGLLTTYTIVVQDSWTSGVRNIAVYRQRAGDSSPTEVATSFSATLDWRLSTAQKIMIGNASFDADMVVGFVALYHKPLTSAEMAQNHRSAITRMTNQPVYVNSAVALYGNGTPSRPYSVLQNALRTAQPNQIVYIKGGGNHAYIQANTGASGTFPSSTENISIIGTGSPVIQGHVSTVDLYPFFANSGSWSFTGITFDARSTNHGAAITMIGTERLVFDNCTFKDADGSIADQYGTGLTSRCPDITIRNCTVQGCGEHGVYLRLIATSALDAYDGTFVVDGLTITGCGYNGFRCSSESAYGGRYRNVKINKLNVTGGAGAQLYLLGVSDGVVTNCLLKGKLEHAPGGTYVPGVAVSLGQARGYTGETLVSDYICENLTVANVTVVDSFDGGVWLGGDAGSITLRNIITTGCDADDFEDATSGTCVVDVAYCAGDSSTGAWATGNGNIPGAAIDFVGSTYVLEPTSDGYGDGVNLTSLSTEAQSDLAGTARPATGAWNMGAY